MKHHTFKINCGFTLQYTFDETEIGPDGEPTEDAVQALEEELEAYLRESYSVDFFDVVVDLPRSVFDCEPEN